MNAKKNDSGMSYETKTIIVVLTLLFVTPVGLILMWVWMKWPLWVRILLTILPFLFAFLILTFVFLFLRAIFYDNPIQKDMKKDTQVEISQRVAPKNEITNEKAIKIAKQNGMNASDLLVDNGSIIIWTNTNNGNSLKTIRIKSCSLNKTMHLDPKDGEVLKFIDEIWCGGTP